jgi:hypothetical protein
MRATLAFLKEGRQWKYKSFNHRSGGCIILYTRHSFQSQPAITDLVVCPLLPNFILNLCEFVCHQRKKDFAIKCCRPTHHCMHGVRVDGVDSIISIVQLFFFILRQKLHSEAVAHTSKDANREWTLKQRERDMPAQAVFIVNELFPFSRTRRLSKCKF